MTRPVNKKIIASTALLVLAMLLGACAKNPPASGSNDPAATASGATATIGDLVITGAWARPAEQGGSTAVYMVIQNNGESDDALHDVAAPAVTDEAMLHESKMVDNVMIMEHVHQIDIPAGGSATLERGGLHIMLIDVKEELKVGARISVTLHFEHAGTLTLDVPVEEH